MTPPGTPKQIKITVTTAGGTVTSSENFTVNWLGGPAMTSHVYPDPQTAALTVPPGAANVQFITISQLTGASVPAGAYAQDDVHPGGHVRRDGRAHAVRPGRQKAAVPTRFLAQTPRIAP